MNEIKISKISRLRAFLSVKGLLFVGVIAYVSLAITFIVGISFLFDKGEGSYLFSFIILIQCATLTAFIANKTHFAPFSLFNPKNIFVRIEPMDQFGILSESDLRFLRDNGFLQINEFPHLAMIAAITEEELAMYYIKN